jgi:hypothetical protein
MIKTESDIESFAMLMTPQKACTILKLSEDAIKSLVGNASFETNLFVAYMREHIKARIAEHGIDETATILGVQTATLELLMEDYDKC